MKGCLGWRAFGGEVGIVMVMVGIGEGGRVDSVGSLAV